MIAIYIVMLMIHDDALTVGAIMATFAIANQLDIKAWQEGDTAWALIFFTWYTILYTAVSTLFI
jgi:hypothetical protein